MNNSMTPEQPSSSTPDSSMASPSAPQEAPLASETPSPTPENILSKLNLPPKPILASSPAAPPLEATLATPEVATTSLPTPPVLTATPAFPLLSSKPAEENLQTKEKNSSKKKFSIGLPLAIVTILIALLAFLMQLRLRF